MSWLSWEPCEVETASAAWTRLVLHLPQLVAVRLLGARVSDLPFYDEHRLIEFTYEDAPDNGVVFALDGPTGTRWLDGESGLIHSVNEEESLALGEHMVLDYVRFFLYFLRADGGAFVLIESPDDLGVSGDDDAHTALRARAAPLAIGTTGEDGRWVIDAVLAYEGVLFKATFAVSPDGMLEMTDDEPLEPLEGVEAISYPTLVVSRVPSDREVSEAIVSVLLEEAITQLDRHGSHGMTLLRHFNATTGTDHPIQQLARAVASSRPIVIIESDLPFVEELVAGLLDGADRVVSGGEIRRASPVAGDELRCEVEYEDASARLHLLSFHAFSGLFAAERAANELALGDAAVLVGCDQAAAVPEPLRRVADFTLTFPRLDPFTFVRIFERVFQTRPAPDWDSAGAAWTGDLVPADFHMPRRMNLDPPRALQFLRERAETRLRQVTPDVGPRLDQLHGLGEARQICEDLIADIHAAQAGEIPWTAVDRGLLMVGAPGTGKTTLARALAKESGVKFIAASAAGWQAAGALDSHLRAMRADFAEARRYAPAILFIDEIDGIGSREALDDRNAVYQTGVIDALLEQIQGIDTAEPVIVVGATNYPDKVDPALRRAGRLDQVVEIPLPNVAGLEQIFDHHLEPYRTAGQLDADVDSRALAELSVGLTGADIEFFVRGAFRRARRDHRSRITQDDLLAEVTRRPRHPESSTRLSVDDIRRVAVHEAGHALARLLSSTQGEDITFVTIVPRTNGSLGFVATLPDDSPIETRRTLLERLETVLAGRAAEEIIYGSDHVGTGAGGSASASDLGIATQLATYLICQSGMGDDGGLRWTDTPTSKQSTQIDELLTSTYRQITGRLKAEQATLERIAAILEEHQEVSGHDLRALLATDLQVGPTVASEPATSDT